MEYKLLINLKSDLCISSGDSFGSLIDNDICYDIHGYPYIPAKRLKGLIREEAEEYVQWFDGEKQKSMEKCINNIFGEEGKQYSGSLKIDNAYIENYDELNEEANKLPNKFKKYLSTQRVLDVYTYTRFQTAIDEETGANKENSLRATRVIKRKNNFCAHIELDGSYEELELFKNAVKLVSHIGLNRTRGFGEVKCKLEDINQKNKTTDILKITECNEEEEINLKLFLKSESEIMVTKQNSESSENYIPGSNILGNIAKRYIDDKNIDFENMPEEFIDLFLNGKVRYSNAYISDKNKTEFYPIPFSYAKVKNKSGEFYNKMIDVSGEEKIQLSTITNKYVTLDEKDYLRDVLMSENYHHQRPKDNSMGHVVSGPDGGTLYQYSAIAKNQYFLANITGKVKFLKKLLPYITQNTVLRIGKSKNTEYGKLRILEVKEEKINRQKRNYKDFAVILTSDVIIFNNGQATTDKNKLIEKIKNVIGNNIVFRKAFINYTKISGYNILWNLPKEQEEAFKAGTVFVFSANSGIDLKDSYVIGNKRNEGYGNLKIMNLAQKESKIDLKECSNKTDLIQTDKINETLENVTVGENIYNTLSKAIKKTIMEEILGKAINTIVKEKENLTNATIGRVMLMLEQSKTIDEFNTNVDSIKNNKKLDKVKSILKNKQVELLDLPSVKDLSTLNKSMNRCNYNLPDGTQINITKEDLEKFTKEYIKQCLIQIRLKGEK